MPHLATLRVGGRKEGKKKASIEGPWRFLITPPVRARARSTGGVDNNIGTNCPFRVYMTLVVLITLDLPIVRVINNP